MSLPDRPGIAGLLLGAIGRRSVNAHFVVELTDNTNRSHIVIGVSETDLGEALSAVQDIASRIQFSEVVHQRDVVLVSIHGPHFRDRPGCAAEAFAAIAAAGVNILAISTSVSSISRLVEKHNLNTVIKSLQHHFGVSDDGCWWPRTDWPAPGACAGDVTGAEFRKQARAAIPASNLRSAMLS